MLKQREQRRPDYNFSLTLWTPDLLFGQHTDKQDEKYLLVSEKRETPNSNHRENRGAETTTSPLLYEPQTYFSTIHRQAGREILTSFGKERNAEQQPQKRKRKKNDIGRPLQKLSISPTLR